MGSEASSEGTVAVHAQSDGACEWEHVFGGQAVMEGVMMRGRHSWGLAVRRPSGGIARFSFRLTSLGDRYRWLKFPVLRGVIALFESLSLGVKALGIAANVGLEAAEDEDGLSMSLRWRTQPRPRRGTRARRTVRRRVRLLAGRSSRSH